MSGLGTADRGVSTATPRSSRATMETMTVLQSRPIRRVKPSQPTPRRSVLVTAAIAAGWCAAFGLVLALVLAVAAWFAADDGSFGGAVRIGALSWLVAQGGGLRVGGVAITALPLGTCLLSGWLLHRSGRWVGTTGAVDNLVDAARAIAAIMLTYVAICLVVYGVTQSASAHADPVRTVVSSVVLSGVFGGLGVVRGAGIWDELVEPIPADIRAVLAGAGAGVLALLAASAALFSASMVVHFSDAITLAEGLHTGLVGGFIIAVVGLAAVPNAVLCSGAYIAGPGFLVGTATTVTTTSVQLGPVPALPILAAVPRSGGAWWQEALVILPVVAGVLAGIVTARRYETDGYLQATLRGAVSGLVGGLAFGVSTWLATGAIGPGRMQDIGPAVLATTLISAAALAIGGAGGGAAWRWWDARSAVRVPESPTV
jgi:hypothetical protein